MIPDPYERTVRIPARWNGAKFELIDGGELPKLADNSICDLVVSAFSLSDAEDFEKWTKETPVRLLVMGTKVLVRVGLKNVPNEMLDKTIEKKHALGIPSRFVKVVLEEDLFITSVPGKKGMLKPCRCYIPAIEATAASLNEACKDIAIQFEPKRRSTSGNVFQIAFIEWDGTLMNLDTLRNALPGYLPPKTDQTKSQ